MKTNQRASRREKNSSIFAKINDFISFNSFILMLLVLGIWFHQVFIVGATINELEKNQYKMSNFLQQNMNKVYFLSASGMVIAIDKGNVSYTDERFKSYILNEIITSLTVGNVAISKNYKISYTTPEDIVARNKNINSFFTRFIKPNGSVIAKYARALHRAIVDGKYPEYISVFNQKYTDYHVYSPSEEIGPFPKVTGHIKLELGVKSWIRGLKKWDTRIVNMNIGYELIIDVDKYVNMGNPFGIHFTKLDIPILHKPTGASIQSEESR